MTSLLGSTLLKRGLEATVGRKEGEVKVDVSGWAITIFALTVVLFFYISFSIEYTFGRLIPILIMVESPQDSIAFEAIPSEEDNSVIKKGSPEPTGATRPRFLTSTFRSSMRLLNAEGGWRGRFRGISMFFAHAVATSLVSGVFSGLFARGVWSSRLVVPFAAVICAQLSLGWTLIVITESNPKRWYSRIPSSSAWKKIAGPTAIYSIVELIGNIGPLALIAAAGWTINPKDIQKLPLDTQRRMVFEVLGIFAITLVYFVGVLVPAKATLTRMQASLVSETEETIVSFDRTFGGKVVPQVVGGSGMVGALDAWKTFDRASRIRLIKAYLKFFAMSICATLSFAGVFIAECAIFAPDLYKFMTAN